MRAKRVVVVIPAYNEERTIVGVIRGLKQRGFTRLIVIDDGSSDRTGELASCEGVIRLRHLLNRGLGGALGTGISAALRLGAEIIVTRPVTGIEPGTGTVHIEGHGPIRGRTMIIATGVSWSRYVLAGVRTIHSRATASLSPTVVNSSSQRPASGSPRRPRSRRSRCTVCATA